MPQYIKSHSNYVLKKRHQEVSDGTIWERDITTIGGVNQFSPGQIPIYKSSNFIITVRNDGKISNQFNQSKWKENESGDTWTLQTISGMTSEFEDQNDVKIVLKQDYYDFCDFAYYGSLTEMFRASITDILSRFPGELYSTANEEAHYTSAITVDGEVIEQQFRLGENDEYLISNPFSINIHSIKKPIDAKPLKYFAEDGYKNYIIKNDENDSGTPITKCEVTYYYFERDKKTRKYINYTVTPNSVINTFSDKPYPCKGDIMAIIKLNNEYVIKAYIGDNSEIVYLHNNLAKKHIRPSEEFIIKFYNECDNFEKILLNRKTNYKSIFSVIQDNEKGYFRKMEEFIFPTSYGGYNVTATDSFINRLSEIGSYYDEYFTDNLWRSMTHEAIKNFDWTFTREFTYGDEVEYVHGGEKMQKALRIFAREFDEILAYIDNIKNDNRVTYDERNNIPDYFLIDEVEKNGWDTCLVYPYDIKEFKTDEFGNYERDENGDVVVISDKYDDENFQLSGNSTTKFTRKFYQNTKKEITPYSKEFIDEYPEGYFVSCCGEYKPCYYKNSDYKYLNASGSGTTYYDTCDGKLKNRIKSYSSDKSYTFFDANNEFMRKMAINSPYIFRHKGTIEGIEMVLGMFGLKSKKWVESFPDYRKECDVKNYDYDVVEYSSFTNRLEEKWDAIHQMYRYDWINSTKSIVYDYRSTSNYTKYGAQTNYTSYQGLPISFRDEYSAATEPYLKVSTLVASAQQETTSEIVNAFKMAETNEPVFRRYLYPNFSKTEQLDGNPYFQMNGGWLSKTLENSNGNTRYNFQFDVNDNIAYTCYEQSGRTENDGSIIDNHPIYKETVRNIKRVDNISELISTPIASLNEGTIYYVSNIEQNVALINSQVYPIKYEYNGNNNLSRYILFTKNNEYIKVGDDLFFTEKIFVYDKEGGGCLVTLTDKPSGFEVKAYIKDDNTFMCQGDESGYYTIDNFTILEDALPHSGFTNYFIIDNPYYSDRIANVNDSGETYGWRALKETDPEYVKINTIVNYYEGNNPHDGNMIYDSGHEYFTYFKRLFKYSMDENLFDERCYENFFIDYDNEISTIGFSGLIDDNETIKQYTPYLCDDSKIHYFGNYYERNKDIPWSASTSANTVNFYGENIDKVHALSEMYHYINPQMRVEKYILNDDEKMIGGSPYSAKTGVIDEVTNQIINNKRFTIKFYLHKKWYSEQGQCELKYLDNIVTNYLTQMIPSTTIVDIQYIGNDED